MPNTFMTDDEVKRIATREAKTIAEVWCEGGQQLDVTAVAGAYYLGMGHGITLSFLMGEPFRKPSMEYQAVKELSEEAIAHLAKSARLPIGTIRRLEEKGFCVTTTPDPTPCLN